jgi:chromate transporter
VVTLIGWEVAGLLGALVATAAFVGPTSIVTFYVGRVWHRFRHARWRIATQAGLAPITIGLVAASAYVLGKATDTSLLAVAITGATAAGVLRTRIHPLVFLAAGGALGAARLL